MALVATSIPRSLQPSFAHCILLFFSTHNAAFLAYQKSDQLDG
jgi:hypothetical protein